MKYLAILRQDSGCDYTIGCGINTVLFEADDIASASDKLREIVKENYTSIEYKLKSVNFYQVDASYNVDLSIWYEKFEKDEKNKIELKIREEELAELHRLKLKYNA